MKSRHLGEVANNRYPIAHDDMRGEIRSAIAGGTAWVEEVMTGTN